VSRDRSSSGSSVQYLGEKKRSPERERGTTFARASSPKIAVARLDSGDEISDNEEKDAIRMLQAKIDLDIARLERMKKRYVKSKSQRK